MSSDLYALVDNDGEVYEVCLLTLSDVFTVVTDAPTIDAATTSLLQAAPPRALKGVIVINFTTFEDSRRSVEGLQKAGYTNIEAIDIFSLTFTSMIYDLPLNCAFGDVIFVCMWMDSSLYVHVLQKCENGWKVVLFHQSPITALCTYPSVGNVVLYESVTNDRKAYIRQLFPGKKLHWTTMAHPGLRFAIVRNRITKGNLKGYHVLPYCRHDLLVKFGTKRDSISLIHDVPPFTTSKEIDVGDAPFVEIRAGESGSSLVKTFNFKKTAFRTVLITVIIDKTLIPQVSLKTIVAREPDVPTSHGGSVDNAGSTPTSSKDLSKHSLNHPPTTLNRYVYLNKETTVTLFTPSGEIPVICDAFSPEDAVKALLKAAPPNTVKGVFILNDPGFENCRRPVEAVQKAGYTNIEVVETCAFAITSVIHNVPLQQTLGTTVFVFLGSDGDAFEPEVDVVSVLRKRENGWQVIQLDQSISSAVAEFPSAKAIVIHRATSTEKAALQKHFRGLQFHFKKTLPSCFITTFIRNRINGGDLGGYEVLPYCCYDLSVQFGDQSNTIRLTDHVPIFSKTQEAYVGDASTVEVYAYNEASDEKVLVKTFKFKSAAFRIASITVNVDKTLVPYVSLKTAVTLDVIKAVHLQTTPHKVPVPKPKPARFDRILKPVVSVEKTTNETVSLPMNNVTVKNKKSRSERRKQARRNALQNGTTDEAPKATEVPTSHDDGVDTTGSTTALPKEPSQLQLDPPPTTILTFTSDNRVLIKADETYTGVTQLLAYVRLEAGTAPIVGQQAFDALKTHPESVFYGITRLMATDFDPAHPDPSWRFKTSIDTDGKVLIHGGDNITTLPIVLFGLVVNSTLLYIKEHQKCEVTELGIRLPSGSVISDTDLNAVSERMRTKLVIVEDK
uniref:LLGL domain-containing protein n=1 Tax=Panagrellus redivivus TaxID=6233 RepID=A0A7E4V7K2_PANRE